MATTLLTPSLVSQQGFGDNAAVTTNVLTPTPTTQGSTLILVTRHAGSATATILSIVDSAGNTWQTPDPPRGGAVGTAQTFIGAAYCHNAAPVGTLTITKNANGSALYKLYEIADLSNVAPDVPAEDLTHTTTTTDIRSAAGTTTQAKDFLLGWAGYSATGQIASGVTAGWTLGATVPATGGRMATAYKIGSAAGAEQAAFTGISTAVVYGAGLLAFKAKETASGTITGNAQAGTVVTGKKVASGTITGSADADTSATGRKTGVGSLTGQAAADTSVTGSKSAAGSITGSADADTTVTGRKVALAAITGYALVGTVAAGVRVAYGSIVGLALVDTDVTGHELVPVVTPPERTTTPPYESRTTIVPPRARTTVPPDTRITTPA